MKKSKYKVDVHFEESVTIYVCAESKEEAVEKAIELADDFGGTEYPSKYSQNCRHRDSSVQSATELAIRLTDKEREDIEMESNRLEFGDLPSTDRKWKIW